MKVLKYKIQLLLIGMVVSSLVWAGNDERAGQAGASELLVNPWSRSTGMGNSGILLTHGIEAMHLNVAGLADVQKLEINFSHRDWLGQAGIDINAFGIASHVGESGVIGLEIMTMSIGKIEKTTVNLPEGGQGTFSPLFFTMGISYAKQFSKRINGGITFRLIHEEITNVQANGVAIDAGINYTTGINDEIKFGIALKNIGPAMVYSGSGLTVTGEIPGSGRPITQEQRSQQFELPSLLHIGLSYDFLFTMVEDSLDRGIRAMHRLSPAFNFTSNSFTPDLFAFGAEYAFKEMFMGRLGYVFEGNTGVGGLGSTALTGISVGATVEYPISKKKSTNTIALDFSWQQTDNFGGITSLGLRMNM